MRAVTLGVVLSMVLMSPKVTDAQAYAFGSPTPEVTAGTAEWQARNQPIVVAGLVYFPTREFRIFDPAVMVQNGVYEGVPVYADVTLQPFSIVYVPVTRTNMRAYERKRDGELAGTVGSRTPSFPVEIASSTVREQNDRAARAAVIAAATGTSGAAGAVGTTGTIATAQPAPTAEAVASAERSRPQRTIVQMIPTPRRASTNGVWLEFNGARWYAAGAAVPFSINRFEPVGSYRGFPVYREKAGNTDAIWVSVVKDGPVAPYMRR